jgi:hypothetical protein
MKPVIPRLARGVAVTASALALSLAVGLAAQAAPPAATPAGGGTAAEIDGLIKALGQSGCSFQRNGSWHDAAAAREHLRRKYEWMRDRDKVASAEQFIRDGASRSSMTGREYQVRCPGQPDRSAAAWLTAQLQAQRQAAARAGAR